MGELEGRRVLVTGASSGIGEATARAIAAAGGRVALLARRADQLEELAEELDGVAVPADVTDPQATRAAIERSAEQLDGLDGLVNAAGLAEPGTVVDGDPASWRRMFDVNVLGLLHATQAAVPHLRAAGRGDVVNLSSMSGRRVGSVEMAIYAASKAAVHTISEGMRRELQPDRVRVAVIAPGLVDTPIFEGTGRTEGAAARPRHRGEGPAGRHRRRRHRQGAGRARPPRPRRGRDAVHRPDLTGLARRRWPSGPHRRSPAGVRGATIAHHSRTRSHP
jgi:NADP-dependent 3-hydroxy acid dehydrogenase YdfG